MIWLSKTLRRLETPHWQKRLAARDQGYTLLELLVVLAILAMIMGIAAPLVMKRFSKAKSDTAAIQVRALAANLEYLYMDLGRYPTADEGLKALLERPGGATAWAGPYVAEAGSLTDPWGKPYRYRLVTDKPKPFEVFSLGADGKEGGDGEDRDVSNLR